MPELVKEIGDSDQSADAVNAKVAIGHVGVRDVVEDAFGVDGPVVVHQITKAGGCLGSEFDGLTNGPLVSVLIGVGVDKAGPGLKVRDYLPIGLHKIIADQKSGADHYVSKTAEDAGNGEFTNCFKTAPENGGVIGRSVEDPTHPQVGHLIVEVGMIGTDGHVGEEGSGHEGEADPVFNENSCLSFFEQDRFGQTGSGASHDGVAQKGKGNCQRSKRPKKHGLCL